MAAGREAYYPLIITFLVVNFIVVALRLYVRLGIKKALGSDDVLLVIASIGFYIFGIMEIVSVHYGLGAKTMEPWYDAIKAAKYFTIAQLLYIIASGVTKLAVSTVLFRITQQSDMKTAKYALIVTMAIILIFTIVSTLVFALQCRPLSVAWGVGTGTCMKTSTIGNVALALSIEDVVTSWFTAILPVYMLWRTTIPVKVRISIMILLGMGAVGSIATIVRLKYVVVIQNNSASGGLAAEQVLQTTIEATIYSILEIGLSIFAAALAALRPLLRRVPYFSDISSGGKSSGKKGNSYHLRTFGQSGGSRANNGAMRLDDGESQKGIIATTIRVHE